MENCCANLACRKPIHYLREGRIFVFDIEPKAEDGEHIPRLQHYWLCGASAEQLTLRQSAETAVTISNKVLQHSRNSPSDTDFLQATEKHPDIA